MMADQLLVSERKLQELEAEWRNHRDAAIRNSEAPDGVHRRLAEGLELLLRELREPTAPAPPPKHSSGRQSPWLPLGWGALALMAGMTFAPGLLASLQKLETGLHGSRVGENVTAAQLATKQRHPIRETSDPKSQEPSQQSSPDPALAMQDRFNGYRWGGAYSALDQGFENYQRLSGTLARIQAVALRRREAAHLWPTVLLNASNKACFDNHHIGAYHPRCQSIKIDYSDGSLTYEHPAEIETTLAHEWGHHLIHLSQVPMSPTEQEVVSDCFAGAVFGYYSRHGLATLEEASLGLQLMADVGNNSAMGHHPNREVRMKSFLGGWFSVASPSHPKAKEAVPSCASLNSVVDIAKIRELGLSWKP